MKLDFSAEQIDLCQRINVPFDITKDLSDDEICEIIDIVSDYVVLSCLDDDYKPTKDGDIGLDILAILGEIEE